MTMFEKAWKKLAHGKSYREEFALAMLKRMVPFQIRAIRKKREMSQTELAQSSNLTQGVISRAEDPDYGNLTLNTIGRIAAGFDLAFVGQFVPFSELVKFTEDLSESKFSDLPTFKKEDEQVSAGGVNVLAWTGAAGTTKREAKKKSTVNSIHELAERGKSRHSLSKDQPPKESNMPKDIKDLAEDNAASGASGGINEIYISDPR